MVEPDPAVLAQVLEPDEIATRVLRGAREQFELVGIRRTTMEDVARHCGIARASLYRRFPAKSQLVDAVVLAEVRRYFDGSTRAHESGRTVAEKIVNGTVFNVGFLREHTLLQKLLRTEPETLLPGLTVGAAALLDLATYRGAAQLVELLHGEQTPTPAQQRHLRTVAELHTRLTLSFALTPHTSIDLDTVDAIRIFANTYLIPSITAYDGRPPELDDAPVRPAPDSK
ncbi:TetR/AcrR family transcriptional regulator [Nocardia alba]|nr:helix-turn-helix domain-containing protein [Nocardia alba]